MKLDETLAAAYEDFDLNVRRLEELISQLELWSDEYTINHKKEEVRLPEYMELHLNLETFKTELEEQMNKLDQEEVLKEALEQAKTRIEERLKAYEETESIIHNWIKEIKNPYMLINNSSMLQKHRAYLESIINQEM